MDKKIITVPYWVRDSLWRSGHKIEDLLIFDKVIKLLSRNEIVILMAMQEPKYAIEIYGDTLGSYSVNFFNVWTCNNSSNNIEDINEMYAFYQKQTFQHNEIENRLFNNAPVGKTSDANIIGEVPGFGVSVTVYPNLFVGENKTGNNATLSHAVAKILYKYECMGKILNSPFFAKHIETLSR